MDAKPGRFRREPETRWAAASVNANVNSGSEIRTFD
jgi:hypothetical protein